MLNAPPRWNAAAALPATVGGGRSLLMLDYDGTLAPFHADRLRALPWPGVAERLDRLATLRSTHVALITGRSARELASLLPTTLPLEIWGSHGREHLEPNGTYTLSGLAPAQQALLDRLENNLHAAGFGAQVERKPVSVAAHWRSLPPATAQQIERIARSTFADGGERAGLHLLAFEAGVEVRSESVHKGHAVLQMLERHPGGAAAYLGDDTTDEDAFAALDGRGLTLLVRQEPRPSHARYWLEPPRDLLAFLDAWIATAVEAGS